MNPAGAEGFRRGGHRRGLALAVVATALLLLVGAVAVHARVTRDAATAETAAGQPTPGRVGGIAAGTVAPAPDQAGLLTGGQVTWERSCGVDLPSSPRYGPHGRDGHRRFGFARDVGGAVVAAAHLLVQVSPQTGPEVFMDTLRHQVTGPDVDALTHAIHAEYVRASEAVDLPYGQPACPIYARLAGFIVDAHTPAAASLRLLVQGPGSDGTPRVSSLLVQLSWADDDWQLVAPPHGDWSRVSTLLPAAATGAFTPMGPEG